MSRSKTWDEYTARPSRGVVVARESAYRRAGRMLTEKRVASVTLDHAQLGLRLTNVGDLAKDLRPGRVVMLRNE